MTDPAYLVARLGSLPVGEISDLVDEFGQILEAGPDETVEVWRDFLRTRAHLLRRGRDAWPTPRVLVQLALEHADESPITRAFEDWISQGNGIGPVLVRAARPHRLPRPASLRVFEGHDGPVLGCVATPSGHLVSWDADRFVRSWDGATGECVGGVRTLHDVRRVEVLEQGTALLHDDWDGCVLFDPRRGAALATAGFCVAVTGHGVLVHDGRGEVTLWDAQSGTPRWSRSRPWRASKFAQWIREDRALVGTGTWFWLFDPRTGQPIVRCKAETRHHLSRPVASGDHVFAVAGGVLWAWDVSTGDARTFAGMHPPEGEPRGGDGPQVFALAPNRVAVSDGTRVMLVDSRSLEVLDELVPPQGAWFRERRLTPTCVVLCCDRLVVIVVDGCDALSSFEVGPGEPDADVDAFRETADGRFVLQGTRDCHVLTPATGRVETIRPGLGGRLSSVEPSAEAAFAIGTSSGEVCLWSSSAESRHGRWSGLKGRVIRQVIPIGSDSVASVAWENAVRVWCLGREEPTALRHPAPVRGARRLSQTRLLTWADDQRIRVWDVPSGTCVETVEGPACDVDHVSALEDGLLLVVARGGAMRTLDAHTGAPVGLLVGHTQDVQGWTMLADGRLLSWSDDRNLRTWDPRGGGEPALTVHDGPIEGVARLHDDRFVTWAQDRTVRVWSSGGGRCEEMVRSPGRDIDEVREVPDGRLMVVASSARIWLWSPGAPDFDAELKTGGGLLRDVEVVGDQLLVLRRERVFSLDGFEPIDVERWVSGTVRDIQVLDGESLAVTFEASSEAGLKVGLFTADGQRLGAALDVDESPALMACPDRGWFVLTDDSVRRWDGTSTHADWHVPVDSMWQPEVPIVLGGAVVLNAHCATYLGPPDRGRPAAWLDNEELQDSAAIRIDDDLLVLLRQDQEASPRLASYRMSPTESPVLVREDELSFEVDLEDGETEDGLNVGRLADKRLVLDVFGTRYQPASGDHLHHVLVWDPQDRHSDVTLSSPEPIADRCALVGRHLFARVAYDRILSWHLSTGDRAFDGSGRSLLETDPSAWEAIFDTPLDIATAPDAAGGLGGVSWASPDGALLCWEQDGRWSLAAPPDEHGLVAWEGAQFVRLVRRDTPSTT